MIDTFFRLCGSGQAFTTSGHVSSEWVDLGGNPASNPAYGAIAQRILGGGKPVVAKFTATVAAACAADPDCVVTLSIVATPKSLATPSTARTLAAFDGATGVDDTTETITAPAHGLTNGTRVTSDVTLAGITAATNYFIRDATTNTFKLAATPGGAAINLTDAGGAITLTWYPDVIVSTGPIAFQTLSIGYRREIAISPQSASATRNRLASGSVSIPLKGRSSFSSPSP